jgi:hypothetical protein
MSTSGLDLSVDKNDKDIGRVAMFCADPRRKAPELGSFAHFLQTVSNSQQRRATSPTAMAFLKLAGQWTGSAWILDSHGLYDALSCLTKRYRNPAAHVDELSGSDYSGCRELTIGADGILWKLVLSTERHK